MLTKRYMPSVKNLPAIMQKIVEGTAPDKFSIEHLKGLGFTSSTDRSIVPLLKDLGFLSSDGAPTQRYHEYRDPARSKKVLGEALKEAYEDLFHINARPTRNDRKAIEGRFKTTHNVTDRVAEFQAMTFFALLELAELDTDRPREEEETKKTKQKQDTPQLPPATLPSSLNLRYNIEIHLPATKDVEVYNAIFRSVKENLVE